MSETNKDHLIELLPQQYLKGMIEDVQMSSQSRKLTESQTFSESARILSSC